MGKKGKVYSKLPRVSLEKTERTTEGWGGRGGGEWGSEEVREVVFPGFKGEHYLGGGEPIEWGGGQVYNS